MHKPRTPLKTAEFICLTALLTSLVALNIDMVLPALSLIGQSLNVDDPNHNQYILSTVFIGLSLGYIVYGPLSDSYGRKTSIYLGLILVLVVELTCLLAKDLTTMLIGRFLQGFGASACRVVTTAIIRDLYSGANMARIVSLKMTVFILAPIIAPAIGQGLLYIAHWRAMFLVLFVITLLGMIWFALRQPETLQKSHQRNFSIATIGAAIGEAVSHPTSRLYMMAGGVIFGGFLGYLYSAQQILQSQYQLNDQFALYFALIAVSIGLSSYCNSKLVKRFSLETLCLSALCFAVLISGVFIVFVIAEQGHPKLSLLMLYLFFVFFGIAFLFGNLSALALKPLGHIAGTATSVMSSVQSMISLPIGIAIGQLYRGTVTPMITGLLVCSLITLIVVLIASKNKSHSQ